jgi:hypothetical protein
MPAFQIAELVEQKQGMIASAGALQRRRVGSGAEACRGAVSGQVSRIYFRADAGFANPEVYEYLEAEGIKYAIRLPANRILQERSGYLLKRPVGRPSNDVRRSHASFTYQAGSIWRR